ncbi:hypothetical protein [Pelagerythrobacter rhizovicinus]|uniref:Uncharacterized protein n=1 Tax=Pelagerythrobacter rhizovicinus TaxID=2268576 RepID=A0A4V1QW56_9SPHN|nr:hypothetical protein [Pelagerythrobacter rhizovicinus]RXZ64986.1 hypothetical protein ETX26_14190 [Pelagerythrobacter rhizovicinus]
MRSDRFEYFAADEEHGEFFSQIDSEYGFKIVERCFDREKGPRVFGGLVRFLNFLREESDLIAKRSIYYASFDPAKLQSRDIVGSDRLAEFNLIQNPDVLTFNCGEQLDHKRLLLSQIGRSKESTEAAKILSRIKKIAKSIGNGAGLTTTGEFVFPSALSFAREGGRLVRTADAPPTYDARIAR